MKKLILSVLLLFVCLVGRAQFQAGTKYLGLSSTSLGFSYSTTEKARFDVGIQGGLFLADQFLMQATAKYNHTDIIDDVNLGLGFRYYFIENGIFLGAGGEFIHLTKNNNDVNIPVEVGYAFYLNHYVTIEPSVYYKMSLDDFSDKSTVGIKIGFGFYF